jgi:hypothetical protein
MKDKFEKLNETFNIQKSEESNIDAEIIISTDSTVIDDIKNENSSNDITKDYEYTRGNLYSLIEKGQEAINSVLELAQETEQPRAYEVVGQLIKNVADATDKLLDLQKKLKDIDDTKTKGPTTVNNALYVGSTAELLKLIKQNKEIENI